MKGPQQLQLIGAQPQILLGLQVELQPGSGQRAGGNLNLGQSVRSGRVQQAADPAGDWAKPVQAAPHPGR